MLRKILLGGVASSFVVFASGAANAVIFYGDEMDRAREMQPAGASFDDYLAREYRDFFLFEADEMYDWIDADYFAEKALMANEHKNIAPENPGEWGIDEAHMPALVSARQNLMGAFDKGAKEKAPEAAAIAQAKYDCWVEQQEEGHQPTHIAACRAEFEMAMDQLNGAMQTAEVAPEPQPAPEPRMVIGEEVARMVLYFDFDKSDLRPVSQEKVDTFVEQMKGLSDIVVFVEGHADRAGPSGYNIDLSERRAEQVRQSLIREGITVGDLDELKTAARGEENPAVSTPDGVPEQANRRVEIVARGMYAEQVGAAPAQK
ncbi:MAG: OmpA family protein [Kiloniellaceae bacterium]